MINQKEKNHKDLDPEIMQAKSITSQRPIGKHII